MVAKYALIGGGLAVEVFSNTVGTLSYSIEHFQVIIVVSWYYIYKLELN